MKGVKGPIGREIAFLRSVVIPINSVEIYSDYKDLDYLKEHTKNAKVIALGEVTHGSSEIFKMKSKIIRYLVENEGFDIFSIEANMPEAYKLNKYVIKGEGNPKKLIKGMIFWTWNTKEILDLVDWMRDYNSKHAKKVIFTGFDMQYYEGAISELKRICTSYNVDLRNSFNTLETNLEKFEKVRKYRIISYSLEERNYFKREFSDLRKLGHEKIKDPKDRLWFLQCVRIIEQSVTFKQNANNKDYRDKCMSENLLWIYNHSKTTSKIIVWAHNGHIQKSDNAMGYYVSRKLKQKYLVIGFALNNGKYTALNLKTGKLSAYNLKPAYPGTYEYYFHKVGKPLFLLDFKCLNLKDQRNKWLNKKLKFRQLGAVSSSMQFSIDPILKDFDMVIFIDRSTQSKLLQSHQ